MSMDSSEPWSVRGVPLTDDHEVLGVGPVSWCYWAGDHGSISVPVTALISASHGQDSCECRAVSVWCQDMVWHAVQLLSGSLPISAPGRPSKQSSSSAQWRRPSYTKYPSHEREFLEGNNN